VRNFEQHLRKAFKMLNSPCTLKIKVRRIADWWLGDLHSPYFQALENAVKEEWGQKPLYIREGGSIPAVRWLEKTFHAVAVNLPMGQASDAAHLVNERICLQNLFAGRRVVKSFLREVAQSSK